MGKNTTEHLVPLNICILTVSDTRTLETDTSGQSLIERLTIAGHELHDRKIVIDDIYKIRAEISQWIANESSQVIIITGGTGFTSRDNTPQAVMPLLDVVIDGFGELFRQISFQQIGTSTIQSRALAGLANNTIIFCVPGSPNACKTAWDEIIGKQLDSRQGPCNFAPHLKNVDLSQCAPRN